MKLSRDKINDISHKVVAALRKSRDFRLKRDPNDVRLELVKVMTEILVTEEKVDKAARTKIRTQKKGNRRRHRGVGPAPQALLRRGAEEARHRSDPLIHPLIQ